MKKFNIVGAFDRHNYGDILFPLIHSRFIKENSNSDIEIQFFALSQSNLTDIGGVITSPLKELLSSPSYKEDRLIMCGGDILTVDWVNMIGHLSSRRFYFILKVLKKILGSVPSNALVRMMYGQKNKYPYVLSNEDIKSKIFYTGVGGSGFGLSKNNYIDAIPAKLSSVDSISVRENLTKNYLLEHGVECNLVPDTALIMSNMYSLYELESIDWKGKIQQTSQFNISKYIVFQAARHNVEHRLDIVEDEIRKVLQATGSSILLLPIGRATGHEDHIVLEALYKKLSADDLPVAIQNSEHVLHIMSSLAHANSYIGTSLHGAITAYSFGHKVCAFSTKEVKKLQEYLDAWLIGNDYYAAKGVDFSDGFISLCKQTYNIENLNSLNEQKNMVMEEMSKYL